MRTGGNIAHQTSNALASWMSRYSVFNRSLALKFLFREARTSTVGPVGCTSQTCPCGASIPECNCAASSAGRGAGAGSASGFSSSHEDSASDLSSTRGGGGAAAYFAGAGPPKPGITPPGKLEVLVHQREPILKK